MKIIDSFCKRCGKYLRIFKGDIPICDECYYKGLKDAT